MIKAENQKKRKPFTAQDTIPYKEIYKDGICRTDDNYYSKMVQFYDINYQLAQNDDKAAIFENYCEFLNSFDSSVEVQITFLNQQVNFDEYAKNIDIPEQDDCFNDIRKEYSDMLKMQLSKGNNGLVKTKYITFSIKADNLRNAKSRLERIEASVLNNFKVMGAMAEPLNINVDLATQVSYPVISILGEVLQTLRPWENVGSICGHVPFQTETVKIGDIPISFRAHNEIEKENIDGFLHMLFRISVGFAGGQLTLFDPDGPVIWNLFSESMQHRLYDKVAPYYHQRSAHQSQSAQEQDVLRHRFLLQNLPGNFQYQQKLVPR